MLCGVHKFFYIIMDIPSKFTLVLLKVLKLNAFEGYSTSQGAHRLNSSHNLHCFKTWWTKAKLSHDFSWISCEHIFGEHLVFFMLYHNRPRYPMNSSLDYLVLKTWSIMCHSWDNHNLVLKPYIEWFSYIYSLKILILHGSTHKHNHALPLSSCNKLYFGHYSISIWTSSWLYWVNQLNIILLPWSSIHFLLLLLLNHDIFIPSTKWAWCLFWVWWHSSPKPSKNLHVSSMEYFFIHIPCWNLWSIGIIINY
jgi:hypothetical protein